MAIEQARAEETIGCARLAVENRGYEYFMDGVAYGRAHLPLPAMEAGAWD